MKPKLPPDLDWNFPAPSTHDGIPLGNGTFGALVWGHSKQINITVNRVDYWDHRGGLSFSEEVTFANLKRLLAENNYPELRRIFEGKGNTKPGEPCRPTRLPMGRVKITFDQSAEHPDALLEISRGCARIDDALGNVKALLAREKNVLLVRLKKSCNHSLKSVPAYGKQVDKYWAENGLPNPEVFDQETWGGWSQTLPADPAMAVIWKKKESEGATLIAISCEYGVDQRLAIEKTKQSCDEALSETWAEHRKKQDRFWKVYWEQAASVSLPERPIEELYWLGMFKLAGLSVPGSPPATLQGPWVEEFRMPPWSCDYHFNINVQECYWPALSGNQLESFEPLIKMLKSWMPTLKQNAKTFLGIEDGLMLPYATDVHCVIQSGFWTGLIDHGSTAWMAQIFWLYYKHTLDKKFLEKTAYPFMKGAMRVYEEMLEKNPDGSYSLPVSVSPEYGGNGEKAWGKNASFQLALIHCLAAAIEEASAILGINSGELLRWKDIHQKLPRATLGDGPWNGKELQLWEGQPLEESHRHHPHLAGIFPFDIFDLQDDSDWHKIAARSLKTLELKGAGLWSAWGLPWLAALYSRMGMGDSASLILEIYRLAYNTAGRASTHDPVISGYSAISGFSDVMQIDATMGACHAVTEMLAHTKRGILHVFPAVPRSWKNLSFTGIRTEGAFLVSGEIKKSRVTEVLVESLAGARLKLKNPFPATGCELVKNKGLPELLAHEVITLETSPGDILQFKPFPAVAPVPLEQ